MVLSTRPPVRLSARPTIILKFPKEMRMTDLLDRLTELQHRVTELRDFL
jgi:hypothetical protein